MSVLGGAAGGRAREARVPGGGGPTLTYWRPGGPRPAAHGGGGRDGGGETAVPA